MATTSGFEGVPWMVGGGARHSADVGRMLAFVSTGGAEGVAQPGDWKVTATPNGKITIARGSGMVINREPTVEAQSYAVRAPGVSTIDIDLPASSARSDLVIVRVEDPQYGWPAYPAGSEARKDGPYAFPRVISGVSPSVVNAKQLGIADSHYAIARIDIPAGATEITQEMIKDLRKLVQARQERFFDARQHTTAPHNLTPAAGNPFVTSWPNTFNPQVTVPDWATTFRQTITVANIRQYNEVTSGQFRAMLGTIGGAAPDFTFEAVPYGTRTLIGANGGDCTAIAGQIVQSRSDGLVTAGGLYAASGVAVIHDIQFYELPI